MAILKLEDGTKYTDPQQIAEELSPLGVVLNYWTVGDDSRIQELLAQESLEETEKNEVLENLDHYFEELKAKEGYQSRDLIVLHPGIPNLDNLLSKFDRIHTHADDEVRYIIDGEGIFGFVRPDGTQVELTIQAQEYINVPAGTKHWFYLTPEKRVKAVRYFITTEGWVPEYTDIPIRFRKDTVLN